MRNILVLTLPAAKSDKQREAQFKGFVQSPPPPCQGHMAAFINIFLNCLPFVLLIHSCSTRVLCVQLDPQQSLVSTIHSLWQNTIFVFHYQHLHSSVPEILTKCSKSLHQNTKKRTHTSTNRLLTAAVDFRVSSSIRIIGCFSQLDDRGIKIGAAWLQSQPKNRDSFQAVLEICNLKTF